MSLVSEIFDPSYTRNLPGLDIYKYYAIDRSPLANYVMQPFWNSIVHFLPIWMAPNLVTLIGFIFIISAYVICWFYAPTMTEELPLWFHLYCPFAVFCYQTLDALDGKQARRTGTSSPMGELFDHSCDAMSTSFLAMVTGTTLRFTPYQTLYSTLFTLMTFYVTQWEQFHRGVMEFWYFNVTEGQFIFMFIQILTFFKGRDFWLNSWNGIQYNETVLIFGTVMLFCMNASLFISINHEIKKKKLRWNSVLSQLFMLVWIISTSVIWAVFSPANVIVNHPHFYFISLGFTLSTYVGEIVVSRVCRQKLYLARFYGLPLALLSLNALTIRADDTSLAFVYWVFSIIVYLHFVRSIVVNMCKYLKIQFLTIPIKIEDNNNNNSGKKDNQKKSKSS